MKDVLTWLSRAFSSGVDLLPEDPEFRTALMASVLTAVATYGIERGRRRHERKAATQARRREAYAAFSHTSGAMVQRCEAMRFLTWMRVANPKMVNRDIDASASNELMLGDLRPLHEALTNVVVVGSPDSIKSALTVMGQVSAMMRATEAYVVRGWNDLTAGVTVGLEEVEREVFVATDQVQEARKEFAKHVRDELKEKAIDWEEFSKVVAQTVGPASSAEARKTR